MCARQENLDTRLDLLKYGLEHGFDATAIHAPRFEDWPKDGIKPSGLSISDIFYIEYFRLLLKDTPNKPFGTACRQKLTTAGFTGSTTLHDALLNGPPDSAKSQVEGCECLEDRGFSSLSPGGSWKSFP